MTKKQMSQRASSLFAKVASMYDHYDYKHALAILKSDFAEELIDVCEVLLRFRITEEQIKRPGGNESEIPKALSELLRPRGWLERKLTAKLVVDNDDVVSSDTHLIDYMKNKVAFDLEWNSKDQTFDRDLYAFRAFFEYNKISAGILVTRSDELENYFKSLGEYGDKHGDMRRYNDKFGASTTHMGKLLPRLEAGRSGGCPVLALGITKKLIVTRSH